jgi:5'-methylthioadenosine/S-adenosylhomocysteine nucleosidase
MLCQHLIDEYLPERILFIGVAGSLNPDLTVGDTLIARDCLFHDMDVTPFGFKPGEIPFTPYRILLCDSKLVELSRALPPRAGKALVGRVLTGDQFIASATERARLREEFNGDAVEMEGASVGLVATVNQIPFLLLRTISDEADGKGKKEFHRFLEFASDNAWHYLRGILRTCEV